MFQDILNTFCQYTGYDPVEDFDAASAFCNRAAKDLYNGLEADALMREVVLIVPAGTQISLPPWIGELRGAREYNWSTTVPINEIGVPRFSSDTQKYRWRNWTLKGKSALASSIQNSGALTLVASAVENPPAVVSIRGRTTNAHLVVENVTLDTVFNGSSFTQKTTTSSFAEILSISSTSVRQVDVSINDINGNNLAVLYNNEPKTSYLIVDVSLYSWIAQVGDGFTTLMEVLYKTKFYPLLNLTDEFPADGYDDAVAYKAVVLWTVGQGLEKDSLALQMNAFAKIVIDSNVSNAERGQVLKIQHDKNAVYNVFKKFRTCFNWRRTTWSERYW